MRPSTGEQMAHGVSREEGLVITKGPSEDPNHLVHLKTSVHVERCSCHAQGGVHIKLWNSLLPLLWRKLPGHWRPQGPTLRALSERALQAV